MVAYLIRVTCAAVGGSTLMQDLAIRCDWRTYLRALTGGIILLALTERALAQDPNSDFGGSSQASLAEIIVTAQKREQSVRDVPLTITVASGEHHRESGVTDLSDLSKVTPGFTAATSQSGTPIFSIRGVGFSSFQVGSAPTVSTYLDEASLTYPAMTRGVILDVERVEVLKGPQGILFGQNATGGSINFI